MTKFMLGTANFGNAYKGIEVQKYDACKILEVAWELGIRTIDTARSYGESEQIIADFIKMTGARFKVYTKGRSQEDFLKSADILGSNLYAKLWHYNGNDTIDCQVDGISCYGEEWEWVWSKASGAFSILQLPWNLLDRKNAYEFKKANEYGFQTIARSVFLRGQAFLMPVIAEQPFWVWCLQDLPDVDYVIVGADNWQQLREIMQAPKKLQLLYKSEGLSWIEV